MLESSHFWECIQMRVQQEELEMCTKLAQILTFTRVSKFERNYEEKKNIKLSDYISL